MKVKSILAIALAAILPAVVLAKSKKVTLVYGDGEVLEPGDVATFMVEDMPESIGGYEVMTEYLPDGVMLEWTGKKLKAPKAGKVKYSKKEGDFVATSDDNPSGLKISLKKKTGKVSGSFKVYVQKSEKKLKAYSAKFSGYLGGEITVKIKKAGTFSAVLN